jgi:hypothetical protein
MPNTHQLGLAIQPTLLVPPASSSAARTSAAYVDMRTFEAALLNLIVGAIGAGGTLTAQLVQATSSGGAGSKNLGSVTFTTITDAGGSTAGVSNSLYGIEFRTGQMDLANGFYFVGVTITAAVAASISGAELIQHRGRTLPVPASNYAQYVAL